VENLPEPDYNPYSLDRIPLEDGSVDGLEWACPGCRSSAVGCVDDKSRHAPGRDARERTGGIARPGNRRSIRMDELPSGLELDCPIAQPSPRTLYGNSAGKASFESPHASPISCSEIG
jgi:hypothetical protein